MTDAWCMEQALALAALGEGTTAPNPRVGCLLVRDGEVVGRGWHRAAGLPHAEAMALAEAGPRATGATLYVNLEPCAHQGRTPPCASGLVAAGVDLDRWGRREEAWRRREANPFRSSAYAEPPPGW